MLTLPVLHSVSTTRRADFKKCRRLYGWKYIDGYEPKVKSEELAFGSALHEALAAYHMHGNDPVATFVQSEPAQQVSPEGIELGEGVLRHYKEWDATQEQFEYTQVEVRFSVPIEGQAMPYVGYVDGVCRDGHGKWWLVEHKGYAQLANLKYLQMDDQVTSYVWAMGVATGLEFEGVIYNQLRKKLPAPPRLLKSGTLSQSKDQDTTYEVYYRTIKEAGLAASDYADILGYLHSRGNTFFRREKLYRNSSSVEGVRSRIISETAEMQRHDLALYPTISRDCAWCQFYNPCLAVEDGTDAEYLLKALYTQRPRTGGGDGRGEIQGNHSGTPDHRSGSQIGEGGTAQGAGVVRLDQSSDPVS